MAIVRFETNIAQRVTLKFAQGREVEGQFGIQFLHSLVPDGQVYFSPFVEDKIRDLGIRDGETIEVCKREVPGSAGRKKTEWQVQKVSGQSSTASTSAAPRPQVDSSVSPRGDLGDQTQNIPCQLAMDRALTVFLIAAGRASKEAEQVLGSEGGSVRFDSRDIAALATTCLIQSFKEGWVGWLNPDVAQQTVAAAKIQQLTSQPKPMARAGWTPILTPEQLSGTRRGEIRRAFDQLREKVGETEYAKQLEAAGVHDPMEIRYLDPMKALYTRLLSLAEAQEVAA